MADQPWDAEFTKVGDAFIPKVLVALKLSNVVGLVFKAFDGCVGRSPDQSVLTFTKPTGQLQAVLLGVNLNA